MSVPTPVPAAAGGQAAAAGPPAATAPVTPPSRLGPVVVGLGFAVLCVSWMLNAMDRQVYYPLLPQIREELGFSLSEAGFLATGFTLGLAVAGFVAGFVIDRYARKTVVVGSVLVFSVGTGLIPLAGGFLDMAAYRLLSGVGEGVQATALYAIIGAYFFHKRAFAAGFVGVAFGAGIFLGPLVGVPFSEAMDSWRAPFLLFACLGLLMAVLILVLVPREMSEAVAGERPQAELDAYAHLPRTTLNRNTVVLGAGAALAGVTFYGYLGLYPTFLAEQLGFTPGQRAVAVAAGGLGAMLALLFGWFGDRYPQRVVLMISFVGTAVVAYPMYAVATDPTAQYVLSFLVGAFASGGLFTNFSTALQRSVHPDLVGRGQGVFVLTYYVAAAFSGLLFARLVAGLGWDGAGTLQIVALPLVGAVLMLAVDQKRMIQRV
ncbi:MFS transporter [Nocardioides zeae]|uniref:MFS family permease n=1 Tax=Nocardioides zeae TaxID=1457234 RepID=A0AAJ1U295_9ACTN|nr:MFS transporter [Nocardioides zeae]MDQ1106741.1 MFS family permease [Nocardioides zeae]